MKKKILSIILTGSLLLSVGVCNNRPSGVSSPVANEPTLYLLGSGKKLAEYSEADQSGYRDFALNIFAEELKKAEGGNVLLSPASILGAMEQAAAGANGNTLSEITKAVVPGVTDEEALEFASGFMQYLKADSMKVSNGLWLNSGRSYTYLDAYKDYLKEHFGSEITEEAFSQDTIDSINEWVNRNTNGMIPSILESFDPNQVVFIVNAIAFESEWKTEYTEDQILEDMSFTEGSGEIIETVLLASDEKIYLTGEGVRGFIKPYKDGRYGFMALLPDDADVDINEYAASLTGEKFGEIFAGRSSSEVHVLIPEFEIQYGDNLVDSFKELGVNDAFIEGAADFGKISDGGIYIKKIIHKAAIVVNREGTAASAATVIEMRDNAAMPEEPAVPSVFLNRPFVYSIVDMETGLPVFLGTVNEI